MNTITKFTLAFALTFSLLIPACSNGQCIKTINIKVPVKGLNFNKGINLGEITLDTTFGFGCCPKEEDHKKIDAVKDKLQNKFKTIETEQDYENYKRLLEVTEPTLNQLFQCNVHETSQTNTKTTEENTENNEVNRE